MQNFINNSSKLNRTAILPVSLPPTNMNYQAPPHGDHGEEVPQGRVKAAVLPMGGPASRRVKRQVEGGPVAKCKSTT